MTEKQEMRARSLEIAAVFLARTAAGNSVLGKEKAGAPTGAEPLRKHLAPFFAIADAIENDLARR